MAQLATYLRCDRALAPARRVPKIPQFLKTIDRQTPAGLQIHLILDNYATHKHPNVQTWLAKNPRFHLHFTPRAPSHRRFVRFWGPVE